MKECEYCEHQGGCSLCEICKAGDVSPEREQTL